MINYHATVIAVSAMKYVLLILSNYDLILELLVTSLVVNAANAGVLEAHYNPNEASFGAPESLQLTQTICQWEITESLSPFDNFCNLNIILLLLSF